MLALDDERWNLLNHAYGKADDIPEMILELKQLAEIDFENDLLYSYLCHQFTTYSATYAAIPHIVEIVFQENQTIENKIMLVEFCGNVHALRNYDNCFHINSDNECLVEDLTLQIEDAYTKAIKKIKPLAEKFLADEILDDEHRFYMFYMFLAFEDLENLSKIFVLSNFTEFYFHCPICDGEIYLVQQDKEMIGYKEDYVLNKSARSFALTPTRINIENFNNAPQKGSTGEWALFYAQKYDIKPVKYQIPFLFGTMICPHCIKEFRIIDALLQ